jgi:hypothetical protein
MDSREQLEGSDCEKCDFEWAIRINGELVTVASGRLREVDETSMYSDVTYPATYGHHVGFFQEMPGGRLGQLSRCVRKLHPDAETCEVLIEGRWVTFTV